VPFARAVVAGVLTTLVSGCVNHPVGPARTAESFEAKAGTTADAALSAVETVRLLAQAASDGNAFGSYVSIAVSEQEDALGGLRGTFLSIQPPPGREIDDLRDELSALLTSAFNHVGEVRIEARRGTLGDLDSIAAPLERDADELRSLIDELS
jgi:hypothetical protein